MLELLQSSPISLLIFAISLVVAITIHEFSHALVADKLGDPTPRLNDRLTLNPIAHLDPLGTLVLLFLLFTRSPVIFGWGKPVPIDAYNLKNPRRDSALISLSGPGSNLILAIFLAILLRFVSIGILYTFIVVLIVLNVSLAIFNILPIPPLDGAKIITGFLPHKVAYQFEESLNKYGILILILLIFPFFGGNSLLITIISPIINTILKLLLPI